MGKNDQKTIFQKRIGVRIGVNITDTRGVPLLERGALVDEETYRCALGEGKYDEKVGTIRVGRDLQIPVKYDEEHKEWRAMGLVSAKAATKLVFQEV